MKKTLLVKSVFECVSRLLLVGLMFRIKLKFVQKSGSGQEKVNELRLKAATRCNFHINRFIVWPIKYQKERKMAKVFTEHSVTSSDHFIFYKQVFKLPTFQNCIFIFKLLKQ